MRSQIWYITLGTVLEYRLGYFGIGAGLNSDAVTHKQLAQGQSPHKVLASDEGLTNEQFSSGTY